MLGSMANGPPSRFEFDALTARLDRMDERGTSGAGSFQTRLEGVERELRDLRLELSEEKKRAGPAGAG